ncbi:hypothetical protein C8F01DRAFT_929311, partial [Mycena amicta]
MKPYKATLPGSPANCVFKECENLLVPFLGPIFRALDRLKHYPDGWADIMTLVLRKPGKPDYTNPSAFRNIVL